MKSFLLLLLLCTSGIVQAQKVRFSDTSNRWIVHYGYWGGVSIYRTQQFSGDTTWGGVVYQKMEGWHQINSNGDCAYLFLFREDTISRKVFCRQLSRTQLVMDTAERIAYNWNWLAGDSINNYFLPGCNYKMWVSAIDSTLMNGVWHRVLRIGAMHTGSSNSNYCQRPPRFIVEGIGGSEGPTASLEPQGYMGSLNLNCFFNQGFRTVLSPPPDFWWNNTGSCSASIDDPDKFETTLRFYPNPVTSTSRLMLSKNVTGTLKMYDAVGREIFTETVNGQKAIAITVDVFGPGITSID